MFGVADAKRGIEDRVHHIVKVGKLEYKTESKPVTCYVVWVAFRPRHKDKWSSIVHCIEACHLIKLLGKDMDATRMATEAETSSGNAAWDTYVRTCHDIKRPRYNIAYSIQCSPAFFPLSPSNYIHPKTQFITNTITIRNNYGADTFGKDTHSLFLPDTSTPVAQERRMQEYKVQPSDAPGNSPSISSSILHPLTVPPSYQLAPPDGKTNLLERMYSASGAVTQAGNASMLAFEAVSKDTENMMLKTMMVQQRENKQMHDQVYTTCYLYTFVHILI